MRHREMTDDASDTSKARLHGAGLFVDDTAAMLAVTTAAAGKIYFDRDTKGVYYYDESGAFNYIGGDTARNSWQEPVISKTTTAPPVGPTLGDRYVVPDGATGAWAGLDDSIVEWNGGAWDETTPTNGMVVEVNDEDILYLYTTSISGGTYIAIGGAGDVFGSGTINYVPLWSAANTLTDSGLHYDPATGQYICDVRFKSTGYIFFDTTNTTTRIGYGAGANLTLGTKNVLLGESAGVGLAGGNENTAVGYRALYDVSANQPTSSQNTAFGKDCMGSGAGIGNTAMGLRALSNFNGGSGASRGAVSTQYSCAFGLDALNQITSGMRDIGVGWDALFALTTGSDDLGIGREALVGLTTESNNTALGNYAGAYINGNPAGSVLKGLSFCTFLGEKTGADSNGDTNSTAIGYLAQITKSNQIVYGNDAIVENLFSNEVLISSLAGTGTELAFAIEDRQTTPERFVEFYAKATGSPGGEKGLHLLNGAGLYAGLNKVTEVPNPTDFSDAVPYSMLLAASAVVEHIQDDLCLPDIVSPKSAVRYGDYLYVACQSLPDKLMWYNLLDLTDSGQITGTFNYIGQLDVQDWQEPDPLNPGDFLHTYYLLVADEGGDSIQRFTLGVTPATTVYYDTHGTTGTGDGQFVDPTGVAAITDYPNPGEGRIFVADQGNNRVQIFDQDFAFVDKFGSAGSGDGEFSSPRMLDADASYIYVADQLNNRVQIFSLVGAYVAQIGGTGSVDKYVLATPGGVAVDASGNIYVSDSGNARIAIFDSSYVFLRELTSPSQYGPFENLDGISVNGSDLYVADIGGAKIVVLSSVGTVYDGPLLLPLISNPAKSDFSMGGFKITSLDDGVAADDAAAFGQIAAALASYLPLAGGTMGGNIAMGGNAITGLSTPASSGDAVPIGFDVVGGVGHHSGLAPDPGAGGGTTKYLRCAGTAIGWGAVDLADSDAVTGALPIGNGGTGQTTATLAFGALSPLTTKGDLLVYDTANNRLAVGVSNDMALVVDSTTASGMKWALLNTTLGYVKGPASVTANYMTCFDGTTGKLILARGVAWTEDAATVAGGVVSGKHLVFSTAGGGNMTWSADGNCSFASTTGQIQFSAGGSLIMGIGSGTGFYSWASFAGVATPGTPGADNVYLFKKTGTSYDNRLYMTGVDGLERSTRVEQTRYIDADTFLTPNSADWAVNSAASIGADSLNAGVNEAQFDDTTVEGVGFKFFVPDWCTRIRFRFNGCGQAAGGGNVLPGYYLRQVATGAAWGAWSSVTSFTALTIPASTNWTDFEQTITLATLGLTAGRWSMIEIVRRSDQGGDTLTGDFNLSGMQLEFS